MTHPSRNAKRKMFRALMYMGIRRRPRDKVGPYETSSYTETITEMAAQIRGGRWTVIPVMVAEIPPKPKRSKK